MKKKTNEKNIDFDESSLLKLHNLSLHIKKRDRSPKLRTRRALKSFIRT